MRSWRVFAILLVGALAAAALAPDQLAAWADAHADRPGGEMLADALHAWNDALAPSGRVRAWLHGKAREATERQF